MSGLECGPAVVPQRDYLILAKLEGGRLKATHNLAAALNWTHHLEEEVWKSIGKQTVSPSIEYIIILAEHHLITRFCI